MLYGRRVGSERWEIRVPDLQQTVWIINNEIKMKHNCEKRKTISWVAGFLNDPKSIRAGGDVLKIKQMLENEKNNLARRKA